MSLFSEPVPMPDKKITFKKSPNGAIYVYYTLRAYRNQKGKPTSDEAAIGKRDPETGMLIPNKKYFEIFRLAPRSESAVKIPATSVSDFGNTYALAQAADETGLMAAVKKCFPEKWRKMIMCAFYMVCEGNIMMYMEDWLKTTESPFPGGKLDDRRCSELFASISYVERMGFFEEWVKKRIEQEYIAYDVTSISTRALGIDMAEWGYNRDHEPLPQINLGMYYGAASHIPVYYNLYSGSVTDKSHLIFMLRNVVNLGIGKVRFVLNCGFVTETNMKYMSKGKFPFISLLPLTRIEAIKLVGERGVDIRRSACRIAGEEIYGTGVDMTLYGIAMRAHIFFDPEKQALDEKELYAHIERLSKELKTMEKPRGVCKKYTDYFIVERTSKTEIKFEANHAKIDARLKRAGFFVLISTDMTLTSEEVISIYCGRDAIEKNFDQLKNDLDFRRLHTHLNRTTEGKVFVGFLALILRSWMLKKIKAHHDAKKLTFEKVMLELKKIKVVTVSGTGLQMTTLTKTQKSILALLGVDPQKMIEAVE
jgi:transposase